MMGIRECAWAKRRGAGFLIPWEKIKPGPWGNIRTEFPEETVAQRANSLILEGQKNKVVGFLSPDENNFLLIDGEIRWRAWKYAKENLGVDLDETLGGMYCEIGGKPPLSNEEVIYRQLGYGTDSVVLSAIDQANAISKLVKAGEKVSSISKRLCCSDQHIRDLLKLSKTPDDIQDAVKKGALKPTAAIKTARAREDTQKEVRDRISKGEKIKGIEIDSLEEHGPMTIDEIRKQIKIADSYMCAEKSDKGRLRWQSMIQAFRIVLRIADPL